MERAVRELRPSLTINERAKYDKIYRRMNHSSAAVRSLSLSVLDMALTVVYVP